MAHSGQDVTLQTARTLRLWFLGELVDMLIVATLVAAGIFVFGVPLAPTLVLFAGLLNFMLYTGALAGAVPAILVALARSRVQIVWVALMFASVQMQEGNSFGRLIQKRMVSPLPPDLTILSQTIVGTLLGALGLVLATPLMAALITAVRAIYVGNELEHTDKLAP